MAAILTYHALEESGIVTAVTPARFRGQMAVLGHALRRLRAAASRGSGRISG